jgi:hypothetical protein
VSLSRTYTFAASIFLAKLSLFNWIQLNICCVLFDSSQKTDDHIDRRRDKEMKKGRVREESKVSYKIVKFSRLFTLQGRRKEREPVIFTGARDSKGAPEEQKFPYFRS